MPALEKKKKEREGSPFIAQKTRDEAELRTKG